MTRRVIAAEGEQFLQRDGLEPEPAPWEDGLRADTGRGHVEWWYFDAHFDDGSTVVIIYMNKPVAQRNDPLTPAVLLTITRPDGQILRNYPPFPAHRSSHFAAEQERCQVTIGPNWVQGDLHHYELHAEDAGLGADLRFTGQAPLWRPGAGKWYSDEGLSSYFAWLVAIPFGAVEGTLTYDGRTWPVSGSGYHDHNWGNTDLNRMISHWHWGRAHIGDYTTIFVEMAATKAYDHQKVPVFMLAKGDRVLLSGSRPLSLQTDDYAEHESGKRYPRRMVFHWQTETETVHLTLREPKLIDSISMLFSLPTWKRWLARLVVNPYYFRFQADLVLTLELGDQSSTEYGQALHEMMILH